MLSLFQKIIIFISSITHVYKGTDINLFVSVMLFPFFFVTS